MVRRWGNSMPSRSSRSAWRTDRTSNLYSWVLPFLRTVLRRTYTLSASPTVVGVHRRAINGVGWHYTAPASKQEARRWHAASRVANRPRKARGFS
jgi:hypothetical protein